VHSAKKARKLDPLEVFNLTEEEYRLLEHVASRPRRWKGFSTVAVDFLSRRCLIRECSRGRVIAISIAGRGCLEAIKLLRCT
jgi:hypothetical protein